MNRILAVAQAAVEALADALTRLAAALGEVIDALEADQPTQPDTQPGPKDES